MPILENHRVVGNGILLNAEKPPSTNGQGWGERDCFCEWLNDAFPSPYRRTCQGSAKDSHSNPAAEDSPDGIQIDTEVEQG